MSQQLEGMFVELGITQYLDAFVDQGFDTWDTILDITESDLDALGVKLGHRRKLQRRIANSRGLTPDVSLVTATRPSIEDPRLDARRPDGSKPESRLSAAAVITKRKYRRHPKPDVHAPERPPSAYVLFSNKMRDDLKGRNLTFTEIAKLVGENWQNLSPEEKEPFETQAQTDKDKYNRDLGDYKKTSNYKKYMVYLQEFKQKHTQSQEKDAPKRVKLSEAVGGSPLGISITPNRHRSSRSGTASESEGRLDSEPPPSRKKRVGSSVSMGDARPSPPSVLSSYHTSVEDRAQSPPSAIPADRRSMEMPPTFSASPRESSSLAHARKPSWAEVQRNEDHGPKRHLPSLSDMFDGRAFANGAPPPAAEAPGFPFPLHRNSGSPGQAPSLVSGESRPPSLRQEQSSTGSISSSTSYSHPRTPIEGSLPIHALLAGNQTPTFEASLSMSPYPNTPTTADGKPAFMHYAAERASSDPPVNGTAALPYGTAQTFQPLLPGAIQHVSPPPLAQLSGVYPPPSSGATPTPRPEQKTGLDGVSALLAAGEIVGRTTR